MFAIIKKVKRMFSTALHLHPDAFPQLIVLTAGMYVSVRKLSWKMTPQDTDAGISYGACGWVVLLRIQSSS
jgi:hypothetical protein